VRKRGIADTDELSTTQLLRAAERLPAAGAGTRPGVANARNCDMVALEDIAHCLELDGASAGRCRAISKHSGKKLLVSERNRDRVVGAQRSASGTISPSRYHTFSLKSNISPSCQNGRASAFSGSSVIVVPCHSGSVVDTR
jgi:hypothetical protein